jgi:hypothetical protein
MLSYSNLASIALSNLFYLLVPFIMRSGPRLCNPYKQSTHWRCSDGIYFELPMAILSNISLSPSSLQKMMECWLMIVTNEATPANYINHIMLTDSYFFRSTSISQNFYKVPIIILGRIKPLLRKSNFLAPRLHIS